MASTSTKTKRRVAIDVPRTKTNTSDGIRELPVNDEAARILDQLKVINGDKEYILQSINRGKKPRSGNHFNEHLKKYCEEAGIRYLSSHKTRFYGATALFDAGADPEQIRRIMGHTSLEMTQHYNRTAGNVTIDKDIWDKVFKTKKD